MTREPPARVSGGAREAWDWVEFGLLFDIQQGKALGRPAREGPEQYPFLRTSNILWGEIVDDIADTMSFTAEERAKYELQPGDLLVCEGGEVGRAAVWRGDGSDVFYQNHIHRCRVRDVGADPDFYSWWLRYGMLLSQLYAGAANTTTISNLSKSRLSAFVVPCPPIEEQRAIAHVLLTVQRAIARSRTLGEVGGKLRSSLIAELFAESSEWPSEPLAEIAEIVTGHPFPSAGFSESLEPGMRPLVRIRDVPSGRSATYVPIPAAADLQRRFSVENGDILVGMDGQFHVGRWQGGHALLNQRVARLRPTASSIRNDYLAIAVERPIGAIEEAKHFTTVKHLSMGDLRTLEVPTPPLDMQDRIARSVGAVERATASGMDKVDSLIGVRDSLLNELMGGHRRLHESEVA